MDIDALFRPMKDAPIFGRGNYMSEGSYQVELVKLFAKKSFKGAELFIAEFTIVENRNAIEEGMSVEKLKKVQAARENHPVGSKGTWAPKLAQPNTFGNIKELLFSALGRNARDVPAGDEQAHTFVTLLARALCGSETAKAELKAAPWEVDDPEALVIGQRVDLDCEQVKTKAGGDFTRYGWAPSAA